MVSNPAYPTAEVTTAGAVSSLRALCAEPNRHFWPDDISLLNEGWFRPSMIGGHQQITDACLLALAVRHRGKLATFDRSIPWKAVAGAEPRHIELLGRAARRPAAARVLD